MRLRHVSILLCVLGIIIPYSQFVPWLMEHGLNLQFLVQELFATRIGAFFGLDVIVSGFVLFVLIFTEGRRFSVPHLCYRSSRPAWSASRWVYRSFFTCGSANSTRTRSR